MILRLPLALALVEVLLVERSGVVYGLPLANVEEAIQVGNILSLAGVPAIEVRGASLPLVDLGELAGGASSPCVSGSPAIVLRASGRRVAAVCDELFGKDEIVVKPLGALLTSLSHYLGAAILGDGRIALLLDPVTIVAGTGRQRLGARAQSASVPASEAGAHGVLVVEDSRAVREMQRNILETAGYRVETACDGREALERLGSDGTIELVVTDIEMPNIDGLELTMAIRADPTHASLPVVVVTTRGDAEDRRRGIEAGADAYMVKDEFDQQVLLETVERLVGR